MLGDLFDSPWKIAIIAVLIIVLFGAKKLPYAARSLGQSMRILKKEVSGLHEDDDTAATPATPPAATVTPPAQIAPAPAPVTVSAEHQAQIDALQQQVRDLQRSAAMEPQPTKTS